MNRRNNGITLIVLIITIIILFFLTGVTLNIVYDGDILNTSRNTIDKANNQLQEQKEQEEHAIRTWDDVPGTMIKSNTAQ